MNKKIVLITLSIVLVLTTLGVAYAILTREDNTNMQSYTTGVLEIVAKKNTGSITLTNSLPMSDEKGSVSRPYSFVIANTGNLSYKFNLMLLSTTLENQISPEYIKVKVNDEGVKTLSELNNGIILENMTLNAGATMEIDLRVWLSENTPNTEMGKVFTAKLTTEGKAIYTKGIANTPKLTEGLIPVRYNEEKDIWEKADASNISNNWYSYEDQKWANAVTIDSSKIMDLSGNNHVASIYGAVKNSDNISLDGEDDYINLGLEDYDFKNSASLVLRLKFGDMSSKNQYNFANFESAGMGFYNNINFYFMIFSESQAQYIRVGIPKSSFDKDTYYTVVGTYDGENINLYVDGKKVASTPLTGNIRSSIMPFFIGANPQSVGKPLDYSQFEFTDALIFDRALTEKEIQENYSSVIKNVSNSDGLLVRYDLDNEIKTGTEIDMNLVNSMWTWIPRYKYTIFNANMSGSETVSEQEIEIEFESGTEKTGTVSCTDSINDASGVSEKCIDNTNGTVKNKISTYTHPAFTFGDKELTGFWIGKYENTLDANGNIIISENKDITSESASTFFEKIRNMELNKNIYGFKGNGTSYNNKTGELEGDDNNIDTHLIRNMEWGAVAYLTQSKYGRCSNRECSSVGVNTTYKTGQGESTTKNKYGVYDTSGGGWDVTTGVMINSEGNYNSLNTDFTNELLANSKYFDRYSYGSSFQDASAYKRGKLGDATKEILKSIGDGGAWYGERSTFAGSDFFDNLNDVLYFFYRGGSGVESYKMGINSFSTDPRDPIMKLYDHNSRSSLIVY